MPSEFPKCLDKLSNFEETDKFDELPRHFPKVTSQSQVLTVLEFWSCALAKSVGRGWRLPRIDPS